MESSAFGASEEKLLKPANGEMKINQFGASNKAGRRTRRFYRELVALRRRARLARKAHFAISKTQEQGSGKREPQDKIHSIGRA